MGWYLDRRAQSLTNASAPPSRGEGRGARAGCAPTAGDLAHPRPCCSRSVLARGPLAEVGCAARRSTARARISPLWESCSSTTIVASPTAAIHELLAPARLGGDEGDDVQEGGAQRQHRRAGLTGQPEVAQAAQLGLNSSRRMRSKRSFWLSVIGKAPRHEPRRPARPSTRSGPSRAGWRRTRRGSGRASPRRPACGRPSRGADPSWVTSPSARIVTGVCSHADSASAANASSAIQ